MTIEALLECSADELEKLSDEQLNTMLAPYFKVTRPEFAGKQTTNGSKKVTNFKQPKKVEDWDKQQKQKAAVEMARKMGINLKGI